MSSVGGKEEIRNPDSLASMEISSLEKHTERESHSTDLQLTDAEIPSKFFWVFLRQCNKQTGDRSFGRNVALLESALEGTTEVIYANCVEMHSLQTLCKTRCWTRWLCGATRQR
uniref:Uncharacterized protein n=1 Tax=Sphaerodactylus townsendi TaxID=933632 RepID=A0ACB8EVI0_9SAUR